jgi:hypothetical protein
MAALAGDLTKAILGQSDAAKAFRWGFEPGERFSCIEATVHCTQYVEYFSKSYRR